MRSSERTGDGRVVFFLPWVIYLGLTWLLWVRLDLQSSSAMWRDVQAWLVLAGDLSRISIGSALPPLPTVLELPLALPLALRGSWLPDGLLAATAGASTCVVLNRIMVLWDVPRRWRYPTLALFSLNPLVVFYAGNGSSEMIGSLLVVLLLYFLSEWHRNQNLQALISLGFATGLAALTRFDALIYAVLLVGAIWYLEGATDQAAPNRLLGLLIGYSVPAVFLLGAWVLGSLLIPGEPTRIAHAAYLQVVQWAGMGDSSPSPAKQVGEAAGSLWAGLLLVAELFPLFGVAGLILVGRYVSNRDRLSLSLVLLALVPPILLVIRTLGGDGLRPSDAVLIVPLGFVLAGRALAAVQPASGGRDVRRTIIRGLVILAAAFSAVSTAVAMTDGRAYQEEHSFAAAVVSEQPVGLWRTEREVASYLSTNVNNSWVLADARDAFPVVFFTRRPEMFDLVDDLGARFLPPWQDAAPGYLLATSEQPILQSMLADAGRSQGGAGAHVPALVKEWPGGWRLYRLTWGNDEAER